MKKILKKLVSLALVFSFISTLLVSPVFASQNIDSELTVESKDENYYNELINKNGDLKRKINDLESNNIIVDHTVRSVKGVDFLYYSNSDESITGLIQVHDDFNSEIRVNSINSEAESIEFIKENGNKMILGKDDNEQFTKVLYKSPEFTTFKDNPSWCPYVVGLVGTAIGGLYTKIAGLIGGPIAAIIVAGVSSVGWTYVTEQCD